MKPLVTKPLVALVYFLKIDSVRKILRSSL
jgi:hypothetical protein